MMTHTPPPHDAAPAVEARLPWTDPTLETLAVRETRNDIDPIVEDGAFSFGGS